MNECTNRPKKHRFFKPPGLYHLYSRAGFIDFAMNICVGYNQKWLEFEDEF